MADFDSYSYDIYERLPEWWKEDKLAKSVNDYSNDLIAAILEGLLSTGGVAQPLNCWLTIPEEYTWYHHYQSPDDLLTDVNIVNENETIIQSATSILFTDDNDETHSRKIVASLPNTKRECNAKIQLKLLGRLSDLYHGEFSPANSSNDFLDFKKSDDKGDELLSNFRKQDVIREITITNAEQTITLHNIPSTASIEILTETNEILIDGQTNDDLVDGCINKIKPVIKNKDYQESYIDSNGETQTKNIEIENENKKTEIEITSTASVEFDLQVYLYKPTYTTEQNIQVTSVSAFPIERITLYGYFCHPFNNRAGLKYLWEKKYTERSRTTYDRITKQFDCERFYIEVKFYGISTPLRKGFPQEINNSNVIYQPNPNLDKWGKIYNLPRRLYKPDITKDEEPFTFPKYYPYSIEQDYWYEQRMINEYKVNNEAVNSLWIRDSDYNKVAVLDCIYPYMNDIWVYTETVDSRNILADQVQLKNPTLTENEVYGGVSWGKEQLTLNNPLMITLNPDNSETAELNDNSTQSKPLKISFDLHEVQENETTAYESTPKDIKIKGIELKIKSHVDLQQAGIKLSDRSTVTIPYISKYFDEPKLEQRNIYVTPEEWEREKGYYIIGSETNLFGEEEITREQIFAGNNGKIDFELIFSNENSFLESTLYIEEIILNIYYELIPAEYDLTVSLNKSELLSTEDKIQLTVNVKNTGKISVDTKELFIITSPELFIDNQYNGITFDLEVDEVLEPVIFDIKAKEGTQVGLYDIIVFCEDKIIPNEILVRGN